MIELGEGDVIGYSLCVIRFKRGGDVDVVANLYNKILFALSKRPSFALIIRVLAHGTRVKRIFRHGLHG